MHARLSNCLVRHICISQIAVAVLSFDAAAGEPNVPCQWFLDANPGVLSGGYVVVGWNVVSRSCTVAGTQESLTYKVGDHRLLWTASAHYDMWGKWLHNVNTVEQSPATSGWQDRWCSYAGHFGTEFWFGRVHGYHWGKEHGGDWKIAETFTTSCDIGSPAPVQAH